MIFLKLVEVGVPKEKIGLLTIPLTPLNFILPFMIGKVLKDQNYFKHFTLSVLIRSATVVIFSVWIYTTPYFKDDANELNFTFYFLTIVLEGFHSIAVYSTYMPMMYFFSSISDKNYGGTYLTFFNTVNNLARSLTNTCTLYLANFLTYKHCKYENNKGINSNLTSLVNHCSNDLEKSSCSQNGGVCEIYFDSFYLQSFFGLLISIFWLVWIRKILDNLEKKPKSEWVVYENKLKLKEP